MESISRCYQGYFLIFEQELFQFHAALLHPKMPDLSITIDVSPCLLMRSENFHYYRPIGPTHQRLVSYSSHQQAREGPWKE